MLPELQMLQPQPLLELQMLQPHLLQVPQVQLVQGPQQLQQQQPGGGVLQPRSRLLLLQRCRHMVA